jgi:hypothetical protein
MAIKKVMIGIAFTAIFCMIQVSLVNAIEYGLDVGEAYYNWKEYTRCGTVEESGSMWTLGGYVAGAPFANVQPLRLRSDVEVFSGRVFYDTYYGTVPACNPDTVDSNYLGFRGEGSAGWHMTFSQMQVEPFVSLAYRGWRRSVGTDIAQGYPEWYRTLYGRIGVRADYILPWGMTFHSTFSFDPMLWVEEEIDWMTISGETLVVKNGRRVGWTIESGLQWRSLKATAYWQATRLGKSNEVSCQGGASICFQPKSIQDIIGFKLGYLF